jgi:undecaprenyl-diphosphatase
MENIFIIIGALLLGGIALIIFEYWHREQADAVDAIEDISYKHCFLVGLCQAVAIVPGVSRAAATIIGGLLLGITRKTIVEFSFLLAVPTMLAATGYDLFKSGFAFSADQFGVLFTGFVVSFLVALMSITFLLRYIQKNDFRWFGVYRVMVGLVFLLVMV